MVNGALFATELFWCNLVITTNVEWHDVLRQQAKKSLSQHLLKLAAKEVFTRCH